MHSAYDKDPGGIDYKEFGWKYKKYIYPKMLPHRHHYDGNAIYYDPGQYTSSEKEKPKINLYIYNFEEESDRGKTNKKKQQPPPRKMWRKIKNERKPRVQKHPDPHDVREAVGKHGAHYRGNDRSISKGRHGSKTETTRQKGIYIYT